MAEPDQSPEALVALSRILVAEQSLEQTLSQVLQLACDSTPAADLGGVTLLGAEGPTTAAATNEEARRVDALQYQVNAGPCLDAYRHQVVNRIDSTPEDTRWPVFAAAAAAAGVLSTLSLPLIVAGDGLGAVNLYSRRIRGFSDADVAIGATFAAHASVAVANSQVYWRTQRLADQLDEALSTRGVIEQAKGILRAEQGLSDDDAFGLLVRASQRTHVKLHDVAADLVDRAVRRATERRDPPTPAG